MKHVTNLIPILWLLFMFTNCENDDETIPTTDTEQALILERLNCAGFKTENIEDHDDYVVVEGDMVISKRDIMRSSSLQDNGSAGKTDAWATDPGTVANIAVGENIYCYIQPSMVNLVEGGEWITAIGNARTQWNAVPNCRVHFSQTFSASNADLIFYPVNGLYWNGSSYIPDPNMTLPTFPELPNCTVTNCESGIYAKSAYPVNLEVGKWIVIPDCLSGEPSLIQKTNIIAHELGHILGFRHSDFGCAWNTEDVEDFSCPDVPIWGATHIFGTQPCDTNSLMRSTGKDKTFTDDDRKVARMLYPISGAPAPSITSIVTGTCGNHCRVWTAYIANPFPWYTFRLRLKNTATNQIVKVGNVTAGNSAYTALSYNVAGSYALQVLGTNYQGNSTTYSINYAVVIP